MHHVRHVILVMGDQLDLEVAAVDGFDAAQDAVWMAEAYEESTWASPIITDTSVRRILDFQTVLG